ncbi:MAG TPA: integrin alpha, partial [Actinomycetota bacterium]|nr:integrin alpha [Actinomycetota bacterium]
MRSPGRVLTVLAVVAAAIGVPASGRAAPTGRPAAAHAVSAAPSDPPADFNGDGYGDLAVGVPGENIGSVANAGAVNVIYGSPTG